MIAPVASYWQTGWSNRNTLPVNLGPCPKCCNYFCSDCPVPARRLYAELHLNLGGRDGEVIQLSYSDYWSETFKSRVYFGQLPFNCGNSVIYQNTGICDTPYLNWIMVAFACQVFTGPPVLHIPSISACFACYNSTLGPEVDPKISFCVDCRSQIIELVCPRDTKFGLNIRIDFSAQVSTPPSTALCECFWNWPTGGYLIVKDVR